MTSSNSKKSKAHVWLDSHVHVYETANVDTLLTSAFANLKEASAEANSPVGHYCLLITDGVNERAVERLRNANCLSWEITESNDSKSLIAKDKNEVCLHLILGQQLVSKEGVEVLTAGLDRHDYAPRLPLNTLLSELGEGVAILPWGAGKWLGNRGKLIKQMIQEPTSPHPFMIGDIPARTRMFGGSSLVRVAMKNGLTLLRGTDNLPLRGDEVRAGSFLSRVTVDNDEFETSPTDCLIAALRSTSSTSIKNFGESMNFIDNILSQVRLRL